MKKKTHLEFATNATDEPLKLRNQDYALQKWLKGQSVKKDKKKRPDPKRPSLLIMQVEVECRGMAACGVDSWWWQ